MPRPGRLYRVVRALTGWVVHGFFRVSVRGLHRVPEPPFIIAANHQAWYDTFFIVAALPSSLVVYTMAREDTVFNRGWKRWLLPRLGVFPVTPRQGELDELGVARVYRLLADGAVVLMFPEGTYSRGTLLRPLKRGIAHFALQAHVPICPVAVSGLERVRPFSRVQVSIAPAVLPDPPSRWGLDRRVERMLDRVRRAIQHALSLSPMGRGGPKDP